MCIDFNGYHSGGSSFVYVNDFWLLKKFVCISTRISLALKKKKGKKSQYIVSHPETGLDSPIGSDRKSGCDTYYMYPCDTCCMISERMEMNDLD